MSFEQHPVHRLWVAAGKPPPLDGDGTPILPRGSTGICAVTGGPGDYLYDQAFSGNFMLPRAACTAFRHAGESSSRSRPSAMPQKCLSAAAVWAAKAIALRCATWILEPQLDGADRLEFHPSYRVPKDPAKAAIWRGAWGDADPSRWLAWLLRGRPVGTVAALPQYGIEHGGEQNFHRCFVPGRPPPTDPLIKLQSKHVAIYAQPATRFGVLALQVDSDVVVEVDTERWRQAYAIVLGLVVQLREADIPAPTVARALAARSLDLHYPAAMHAALASALSSLGDLPRHPFWPIFTGGIHVV